MLPARNSAHWMPDIKRLCEVFYDKHLSSDKNIEYRANNFAAVDEYYDETVERVKHEVYPGDVDIDRCLLDVHKIAAVHILGVLCKKLFVGEESRSCKTFIARLPNEHFCLLLVHTIITGWHDDSGKKVILDIPQDYNDCLLQLFYAYKKASLMRVSDTTFFYALSNIIYLVERQFLRQG